MAGEEHVSVAVRDDFVARQTKAKPVPALAELLWNSLDGDATEVSVEFAHDDLAGGMSKIVVYDNGDGFSAVMPVLCSAISAALGSATSDRQSGITA